MYILPSLQDVCENLLDVLVKLNNKYAYFINTKSIYQTNYFIYAKLKEILEEYIKIYKQKK